MPRFWFIKDVFILNNEIQLNFQFVLLWCIFVILVHFAYKAIMQFS